MTAVEALDTLNLEHHLDSFWMLLESYDGKFFQGVNDTNSELVTLTEEQGIEEAERLQAVC